MTELLEQAIAQLKNLPPSEQDAIATMILEEIDSDKSQDVLAKLAAEAMAEYHAS
ncbi:conserved hypothetical protein [Gloeothece citriformis PCC 7424]|uniref:Uncharacterized protein n=2 Tax=Gloeothece TaxID=28070 RepID=B7K6W1_GLOC7|nr:conserved hypothetical protein [Gloeothece citriformis PCC 7424]